MSRTYRRLWYPPPRRLELFPPCWVIQQFCTRRRGCPQGLAGVSDSVTAPFLSFLTYLTFHCDQNTSSRQDGVEREELEGWTRNRRESKGW